MQVVGVDFATRSGHAVMARARDGAEAGSASPHAVIERVPGATGERFASARALQDPEDYREALRVAVAAAMRSAGVDPSAVVDIGTDFTASTPRPVRRDGTPLCEVAGYDHEFVVGEDRHRSAAARAQPSAASVLRSREDPRSVARNGDDMTADASTVRLDGASFTRAGPGGAPEGV
jgi:L-ribulokinase